MQDVIFIIAMLMALPFAVCLICAAGLAFFVYMLWVVNQFGKFMEWLFPVLREGDGG